MQILAEQLRRISPALTDKKAAELRCYVESSLRLADITTTRTAAAFLAQCAYESDGFQVLEEKASGEAYEGRKDLGNVQRGDGVRFKGRGVIQITGRANYREAGKALGEDFENFPARASEPYHAWCIAAWYWENRKCTQAFYAKGFDAVTRLINGGLNGKKDRDIYFERALSSVQGKE
jgi:putative chitinase